MQTSTVAKNDNDVNTGRMKRPSGVVKSVNQYAPPPLREGTFSTMFDIYIWNRKHKMLKVKKKNKANAIATRYYIIW
jgi:hypothetical protein